jgi:hypothetical protein
MPEYADIYSLFRRRNRTTIDWFLDRFMPAREEAVDEYWIPPGASIPTTVFRSASELLDYCCERPEQEHGIYWRSIGGVRPEHGMVFFHTDGSMVLGLSTDSADHDLVDRLCEELGSMEDAVASYITHEDLPPSTASEFIALIGALPVVQAGVDLTEVRAGRARRLGTLPICP